MVKVKVSEVQYMSFYERIQRIHNFSSVREKLPEVKSSVSILFHENAVASKLTK